MKNKIVLLALAAILILDLGSCIVHGHPHGHRHHHGH